jgi:rhodanese-related sulfurtransferase
MFKINKKTASSVCVHMVVIAVFLTGTGTAASGYVSPDKIAGATTIDAEQLIELVVKYPDAVVIDSRVAVDRNDGYIEGSVHLVDTHLYCASLARLIPSPTTPVVFYCNGARCDRGAHAVGIAVACGYRQVYWFRGGIEEWRIKEYPLVQDISE